MWADPKLQQRQVELDYSRLEEEFAACMEAAAGVKGVGAAGGAKSSKVRWTTRALPSHHHALLLAVHPGQGAC